MIRCGDYLYDKMVTLLMSWHPERRLIHEPKKIKENTMCFITW